MPETSTLSERLAQIQLRISSASERPSDVTLVAVTKKFPLEIVSDALKAGLVDLGENYAQELIKKASELKPGGETITPTWHFIGGLQRNKIKKLAPFVGVWHTMDRIDLLTEVAKRAPGARVLIQVNATGEGQKSGCQPEQAPRLVDGARELGLDVVGLMAMGPADGSNPAPAFQRVQRCAEKCEVVELSMGMSADLEIALSCGATIIRVGSGLFGPRSTH